MAKKEIPTEIFEVPVTEILEMYQIVNKSPKVVYNTDDLAMAQECIREYKFKMMTLGLMLDKYLRR